MSVIYLVRHGQASFGSENYDQLSEVGIRQSEILGEHLTRVGPAFDAVYSGPLERQIATARIVVSHMKGASADLELNIVAEFNECDLRSVIEAQTSAMIDRDPSISDHLDTFFTHPQSFKRVFEEAVTRWMSGRFSAPGLETWPEFTRRIRSGVEKLMGRNGRGRRIAVFTSGGAISAVIQMALALSDEVTLGVGWELFNTSVTIVKYDGKLFGLSSFNSIAHLEIRNDPELITYK